MFSENLKKKAIVDQLVKRGYDADPVETWKIAQAKLEVSASRIDHNIITVVRSCR